MVLKKVLRSLRCSEVDAYDFNIYDPGINGDDRRQEYIDHLLGCHPQTRHYTGPNDHIILLSTCFLDVTNGRHIVAAKITDTVPKNTFHTKKSNHSLIVSLMIRRSDGFLSSIPLWIWYIILFILLLLLIFLLIILYLILRRRREAKEEGAIPLLTKLP